MRIKKFNAAEFLSIAVIRSNIRNENLERKQCGNISANSLYATVLAGLFQTYKKHGNEHVLCELVIGKTALALAQRQLVFFRTRLHRILYEYLLESQVTNFYLCFHVPLLY